MEVLLVLRTPSESLLLSCSSLSNFISDIRSFMHVFVYFQGSVGKRGDRGDPGDPGYTVR